jgi:hypothetical protein
MPESVSEQIEREALRQPFPAVEQLIDELPLPRDHKPALRLLAWSVQPDEMQKQVLRATLERLPVADR